ncbi:hypothetical protein BDN71DRAFT_1438451 [Pleurotus eryngii]|uniref:Uncharacterized protein n=1 Tax=Pleurotus eryngii TaxID=5323 RepID=A0A9P6A887_PLEER|nr:hypothetical protein BDN71DRAFT_1438451 [Pleurotus eryngii]
MGNEKEVEKQSTLRGFHEKRFTLPKLPNDAHHKMLESFEELLEELACGYVDLDLMHCPFATTTDSCGKIRRLSPDEHPTSTDT